MPKITYGQKTIHYEEKGTGEPLVFIHGVGLDHAMWEQQVNSLSEYYRVIVYDMIGHGESSHPLVLIHFLSTLNNLLHSWKV